MTINIDLDKSAAEALAVEGHFFVTDNIVNENVDELNHHILRSALHYSTLDSKPDMHFYINSYGGEISAVLSVASTIQRVRDMGIHVSTHINGVGMSGGCLLSQFGDVRYMSSIGQMMMHDVQASPARGERQFIRQQLHSLDRLAETMADIFAARNTAGHDDKQWWLAYILSKGDHYWTAQDALNLGLIDIIENGLPRP